MKLNFIFPGKTRESFYADGIDAYLARLRPMVECREIITKSATPQGAGPQAEMRARDKETALVEERCAAGDYLIILDVCGKTMSSPALADHFAGLRLSGAKNVNLVVGGPWGIGDSLTSRANLRLSLSPMTFPHELARLIVLEQVYRAFAIINHIPYHK